MGATHVVHLIDASVYVFRAYFSVPDNFTDRDGNPSNAVYGFAGFLCSFLEQAQPSHIGIAFDESLEGSFRNDFYPEYKANRSPPPIELKRQFNHCRSIAEAMGITCVSDPRYEADDLIGTLAHRKRDQGFAVSVVSSDKDLAQCIGEDDQFWDFARNRRLNFTGVTEHFGVRPDRIIDFLALTGDAVDNIPGVPGIGKKTASALLGHFDGLDDIYDRLDEVSFLSLKGAAGIQNRLKTHRELAYLSQRLTRIHLDAPIPDPEPSLRWSQPQMDELEDLFEYLKFGPLIKRRCESLANASQHG